MSRSLPWLRPLSLASTFAVQVQHPGFHSLGLHPRPALHPGFPAFLAGIGVGVWTTGLDPLPYHACPFPWSCHSRLTAYSHLSSYHAHESFIFHSQATDHFPQLSPSLFTFLFPWFSSAPMFCPRTVPCRKHQFMSQVTTWVLSDHATSLSSFLISFPSRFEEMEAMLFQKAKQPCVVAERPALTKYAERRMHRHLSECKLLRGQREKHFSFSLLGFEAQCPLSKIRKKKKKKIVQQAFNFTKTVAPCFFFF